MNTTRAIRELLERKGVTPSGDADKDREAAKKFLPPSYKEYLKELNEAPN